MLYATGLNLKAPAASFTSELSKNMQLQDAILVPLESYDSKLM